MLCFLDDGSLSAANRLHLLHSLLHRRLCEERSLLEFLQDARALVLLLEPSDRSVNGFFLTDYDANQEITSFDLAFVIALVIVLLMCYSIGVFSTSRRSPTFSNDTVIA